jgi:hypothetical protein
VQSPIELAPILDGARTLIGVLCNPLGWMLIAFSAWHNHDVSKTQRRKDIERWQKANPLPKRP